MNSNEILEILLEKLCANGDIEKRFENNKYLKVSYKGTGGRFKRQWNIKIYSTRALVCTDIQIFNKIQKAYHFNENLIPTKLLSN